MDDRAKRIEKLMERIAKLSEVDQTLVIQKIDEILEEHKNRKKSLNDDGVKDD
jgi:hypothetical protein